MRTSLFSRFGGLHLAASRERFVEPDPDQPGRELRAFLELVQVRERIDVRLLHDVLDVMFVFQHCARRTVQPHIVAAHQDLEQGAVPRAHALDHFGVGQRGGRRDIRASQLEGSHSYWSVRLRISLQGSGLSPRSVFVTLMNWRHI